MFVPQRKHSFVFVIFKAARRKSKFSEETTCTMSSASSSSAALPAGNGPAELQLAIQPTKITAENVLIRYKGSYEKWGQKIADLDRDLLEGRLRNLDQRTVNKMLASQVLDISFRILITSWLRCEAFAEAFAGSFSFSSFLRESVASYLKT